jgi:hypothetical protein
MNEDIISQINTNLQNSIRDKSTRPTGYKFRTWDALNTWSENPVSGVFPEADDGCVSGNGVDQPLTSKLECFGKRPGDRLTDISLGQLPTDVQTRLSNKTWSLPPDSELNQDLTGGNGDLPLSKFEQRTKDQIIGAALRITDVKYSNEEAFLKNPVGGIQKPDNAFVTLLDDKFINYLQDVIRNFRNVIDNVSGKVQRLGAIYNNYLNGSSRSVTEPAWVDFWQVMLVMQENIERRAYVLNFVVAATDEELDQRAIDIENATRDALLGRQGQPPPAPDPQETEEKIKGRQKFFKQCALLLNALGLKENYNQELINRCTRTDENEGPINNGSVFDERLFMLEGDSHQDNSLSFLQLDRTLSAIFNDLPPRVFSYIKPKIKLFRIDDPEGSNYTETEFIFANKSDLNREENFTFSTNFLTEDFDKGEGAGIKDLSFEFNGTNPAESRNDIEATLSLYFQSFNDFVRERRNEYNPSFYKIRLDVGYNTPDNIEEILTLEDFSKNAELITAVQGDSTVYEMFDTITTMMELLWLK